MDNEKYFIYGYVEVDISSILVDLTIIGDDIDITNTVVKFEKKEASKLQFNDVRQININDDVVVQVGYSSYDTCECRKPIKMIGGGYKQPEYKGCKCIIPGTLSIDVQSSFTEGDNITLDMKQYKCFADMRFDIINMPWKPIEDDDAESSFKISAYWNATTVSDIDNIKVGTAKNSSVMLKQEPLDYDGYTEFGFLCTSDIVDIRDCNIPDTTEREQDILTTPFLMLNEFICSDFVTGYNYKTDGFETMYNSGGYAGKMAHKDLDNKIPVYMLPKVPKFIREESRCWAALTGDLPVIISRMEVAESHSSLFIQSDDYPDDDNSEDDNNDRSNNEPE